MSKTYRLRDSSNREFESSEPGTLGGHKGHKVFGSLDCGSAKSWIARGHYIDQRVFFADKETAVEAGYRPCGHCMKGDFSEWKANPAAYKERVLKVN